MFRLLTIMEQFATPALDYWITLFIFLVEFISNGTVQSININGTLEDVQIFTVVPNLIPFLYLDFFYYCSVVF